VAKPHEVILLSSRNKHYAVCLTCKRKSKQAAKWQAEKWRIEHLTAAVSKY